LERAYFFTPFLFLPLYPQSLIGLMEFKFSITVHIENSLYKPPEGRRKGGKAKIVISISLMRKYGSEKLNNLAFNICLILCLSTY
jgi:hypothetical protein